MKANIPPFYIGQKVVYITGINMPKNSVHVVTGMNCSPCCGAFRLFIEIPAGKNDPTKPYALCTNGCKYKKPQNYEVAWDPNSFRPLEYIKPKLMTFEEINQTEKEEILTLN